MIFLLQELGTVLVFSPFRITLEITFALCPQVIPQVIPQGEKTQPVLRSSGRIIPVLVPLSCPTLGKSVWAKNKTRLHQKGGD